MRLALRVVAQDLDVALVGRRRPRAPASRRCTGSSSISAGSTIDVGARELAELAQLGVRERGLRGAAAAEHDHVLDLGGGERADGVVGGVGDRDLVGVEHEHPGDVDGDVAVADHDRARGGQVELVVGVVGVAVVPGHELGRRVRSRPVLARDPEPVVDRRADRVEHAVVALEQVLAADVGAELDAAEEAEAGLLRGLLVHPRDALDLRVVGRDAGADEPERRRQDLEQVDLEAGLQELVGRVEAGRAGADDRCAQGAHRAFDPRRSAIDGTRKIRIRNVSTSRPERDRETDLEQALELGRHQRAERGGEDQPGAGDHAAGADQALDHVALLADPGQQEDVVVDAERDQEQEREQRHRGVGVLEDQRADAEREGVREQDRADHVDRRDQRAQERRHDQEDEAERERDDQLGVARERLLGVVDLGARAADERRPARCAASRTARRRSGIVSAISSLNGSASNAIRTATGGRRCEVAVEDAAERRQRVGDHVGRRSPRRPGRPGPGRNFSCIRRSPSTDSGGERNCSAKSSVPLSRRLPSAPAISSASTAAASAAGRALTNAPIRGHSVALASLARARRS